MRTILILQILSIIFSTIGLIFHLKAVLTEDQTHEEDEKDRKIARRSTILSILLLACTYATILYYWGMYESPKHEVILSLVHVLFILFPITLVELLIAQEVV